VREAQLVPGLRSDLAQRVVAGRAGGEIEQRRGARPGTGVGDLVPDDEHRHVPAAGVHQQIHPTAAAAGRVHRQQAAPDERCSRRQQRFGVPGAVSGGKVGRHLRPALGNPAGELVGHRAAVHGRIRHPLLDARVRAAPGAPVGGGVVLQVHPAPAPAHHARVEQHRRFHPARLDRRTDNPGSPPGRRPWRAALTIR
jgi:hypothetical protein